MGHRLWADIAVTAPGDGSIFSSPMVGTYLKLVNDETNEEAIVTTGDAGWFTTSLPAGTYTVWMSRPGPVGPWEIVMRDYVIS